MYFFWRCAIDIPTREWQSAFLLKPLQLRWESMSLLKGLNIPLRYCAPMLAVPISKSISAVRMVYLFAVCSAIVKCLLCRLWLSCSSQRLLVLRRGHQQQMAPQNLQPVMHIPKETLLRLQWRLLKLFSSCIISLMCYQNFHFMIALQNSLKSQEID